MKHGLVLFVFGFLGGGVAVYLGFVKPQSASLSSVRVELEKENE